MYICWVCFNHISVHIVYMGQYRHQLEFVFIYVEKYTSIRYLFDVVVSDTFVYYGNRWLQYTLTRVEQVK